MTARLLAGGRSLADHLDAHGPLPQPGAALIDAVARAGLRGRGGAGFPAATKLAAVAEGRRPVVVVNGTEGEPMSAKDALLLARVPHLVLDGAVLAARAVGAREILVVAPRHVRLEAAVAERREKLSITVTPRAAGYVAGEETAVIAHLEGRPPRPRVTPPRPAQRGYRRRPTLVQNVETLAHMALIARHGPDWFRTAGTPERPGTMLVTVSGAVRAPGVIETQPGVPLAGLLDPAEPLRALLVGGYFGAWLAPALDARLEDAWLAERGAAVGAGVIVALGRSACPVAETARVIGWLADESAGQCGPCVHGLGALADVVGRIARGRAQRGDFERLERWTEMVRRRGACAHPDGAARMLASARRVFAAELADHAHNGPCRACHVPSALALPGGERLAA
jgi:NADH:ubiquinone oxidoreductase subunit F (NADH-binding)